MPETERPPDLDALVDFASLGPDAYFRQDPDGVVILNQDGSIAYVNAAVTAIFGYSPQEILGHAVEVLVPEARREEHVGRRDGFIAHPRARHMAAKGIRGRHRDGTELDLYVALSWIDSRRGLRPLARIRMHGFVPEEAP